AHFCGEIPPNRGFSYCHRKWGILMETHWSLSLFRPRANRKKTCDNYPVTGGSTGTSTEVPSPTRARSQSLAISRATCKPQQPLTPGEGRAVKLDRVMRFRWSFRQNFGYSSGGVVAFRAGATEREELPSDTLARRL